MSKIPKKHIIENFGGGVNSDLAGIYLPNGFIPESLNVDFSIVRGAARKRMGYARKNTSALIGNSASAAAITGIYETKLGGVVRRMVTTAGRQYSWDGGATFTSLGTLPGVTKTDLTSFMTARTATDGFVVVWTNGVSSVRKWDGYTAGVLDFAGANGGGDLGISYFQCKYVTAWNNRFFFANTMEGDSVTTLADTWDATDDPIYKHDDTITYEIFKVRHSGAVMTHNDGGYATLAANEYDIFENELYVRCTADADPSTHITITARARERVRWSELGDAEDHDSDNFIDFVTEPGREIVCIKPLRDLLMVYKEDSIWALYATGDAEAPFGKYCVDINTPCYAGFSVSDVKGEHFFLSEEGIMKTNGAKVEPVLVSQDVPKWFSHISKDNWKYSYAATNQYLKQYRLLLPNLGIDDASDKDREIRYDYENNVWSEHKYATHSNVIASVINSDTGTWDSESRTWDDISETWNTLGMEYTRFYTGSYDGFVREHERTESDTDATALAINAYFYTKPINLASEPEDLDKNKKLLKFRARLDAFTGSDVYVSKKEDNYSAWLLVGAIDCDQVGVTGSEKFEGALDVSGVCKEVQWKISNAFAAQPFTVYWIITEYVTRSEK